MKIETLKPDASGAGYFVAELEEPELADDPWGYKWFPEIDKWCEETFGQQDLWGEDPQTGWKRMRNKYFFTEEDKLTWFMIRWL